MYNHLHTITTGNRILLLFMLMLIGLILAGGLITLIGAVINGSDGDAVTMIYIGTVLQSFIVFVVPAFLLAYSVDKNAFGYLGMSDNRRLGHHTLYTLAIFLFSYPFISFLSQWNSQMVLPEAFSELEKTMRSMEDAAMETTNVILSLDSVGGMLLNLLVVALLAALSEELFFRGALQQLLGKWLNSGHAAVWISAAIFSLVHFQFYGFLPRMLLGALLGYLFLYGRNLWIPIIFHFVNNASVIIFHYFWGDASWFQELDELPLTLPFLITAVMSALATLLLFHSFKNRNTATEQQTINQQQQ